VGATTAAMGATAAMGTTAVMDATATTTMHPSVEG
jgi:hypothetical protein